MEIMLGLVLLAVSTFLYKKPKLFIRSSQRIDLDAFANLSLVEELPVVQARPVVVAVQAPAVGEATVKVSAVITMDTPAVNVAAGPTPPIYFKPGEPTTFDEYAGQEHIVEYLESAVRGMLPTDMALEPQMFLGMAGIGKSLLAKVTANELRLRAERLQLARPEFFELFPADIPDVKALDAIVRRAQQSPGSLLFIDEIHDFKDAHTRKLYLLLEENRYKFEDESSPIRLPPMTTLAATTDPGMLHPAFKRRFIRHQMKPATPEQLYGYIANRSFDIAGPAVEAIVGRTKFSGAPWEGLEIRRMAVVFAKGDGLTQVEKRHVEQVFKNQEMDELGLRFWDRSVIKALLSQPKTRQTKEGPEFVCFAGSELNVCTLAQIDKSEYREAVRPRLMARELLQIRPYYGQSLTDKAVKLYGHLKEHA